MQNATKEGLKEHWSEKRKGRKKEHTTTKNIWRKKKRKEKRKKSLYSEDLSVPSIHLIVLGLSSIYYPQTKSLSLHICTHFPLQEMTIFSPCDHASQPHLNFLSLSREKRKRGMKKKSEFNTIQHKVIS